MAEASSISRMGTTEPLELQITRGQIAHHRPLFRWGFNGDIINVDETIWDVGGLMPYLSSAVAITLTSSLAGADEGIVIEVAGLDGSYNEVSQEVTLNASGVGTTTQTFLRIYELELISATGPTGDITATNGGTTYAKMLAGENHTQMATYTVPAGYTLYLTHGDIAHGTDTSGAYMTCRLKVRPYGSTALHTHAITTLLGTRTDFAWCPPLAIPEKTDIEARAICSKNQANAISASFQGILIKNDSLT